MSDRKTCLLCKHFILDMGTPRYGPETPGEPPEVACRRGHWEMNRYEAEDAFRRHVHTAPDCKDYEE